MKGRKNKLRIKGICQAAADLGVTRQHLRLTVLGERGKHRTGLYFRWLRWNTTHGN